MTEARQAITVPTMWTDVEQSLVLACNQLLIQRDGSDGDFYITLGNVTPPIIVGEDDDEKQKAAARIGYVPIRTVARLAVSPKALREFADVFSQMVQRLDAVEKGAQNDTPND